MDWSIQVLIVSILAIALRLWGNLSVQILTGIFLAMHYSSHVDYAFSSVEHIMRDVNNGWLLRYLHIIKMTQAMIWIV